MLDNYKALKSKLKADISYYSQWDELLRDAQPSDGAYNDERQKLQAELEVEQEQAFTPGLHSDAMERSFALIVKLKRRIEELDNAHALTTEKNEAQMKTLRGYLKKLHDRIGDSMSKLPPVSPSTPQPTSRGSPILGDLDLSGMDGVEPPPHVDEIIPNPFSEACSAPPDNLQEAQSLDHETSSLSALSPSRSSRPQSPVLPADKLPAITPIQNWKRPRKDQEAVEGVKVKDEGQADDSESTHSAKRPRVHVDKENVKGQESSPPGPSDKTRAIDFEDVFQNGGGEYRHFIIEDPSNPGKFYIFMCEEHGVHFNSDALKCAGRHLDTKGHGSQPRAAANAIKVLGIEVLNCNAALAKKNNTALAAAIKSGNTQTATERKHSPHVKVIKPEYTY
ncbi:uncharacterized protein DNG_04243 [Cephalotrichum gorgonifer]|uniref:Uncharacterized protein n=1 Tax=Cephalotrichum gorgonifer TaxID=2041049 RepID=A0AAE8MVP4_9PEZI|nr:uncharacterized protein DNG_04243 [Cephalotrichum gorgonifer]